MKLQLHRVPIRDCPFADRFAVPAMLYDAGRESHVPDCDVPYILHIFLTLKVPARQVLENHLYAYSVIAVQDDFPVLSDFFHIKTCFCEYYRRLAQWFLCYFLTRHPAHGRK